MRKSIDRFPHVCRGASFGLLRYFVGGPTYRNTCAKLAKATNPGRRSKRRPLANRKLDLDLWETRDANRRRIAK